ncbi:MAG: glycine/sarcosine/betaine reductase selenoprotein B family protein [Acidimicrobiia bacterium]
MSAAGDKRGESFADFRSSFSYGERTDLSFKFMKSLPPDEAAEFLRLLLVEVGDLLDSGSPEGVAGLVYEWQLRAYTPEPGADRPYAYQDAPFAPMRKPLRESKVGLVTSSGHFAAGDDPEPFGVEHMTQEEAVGRISDFMRVAPDLAAIPRDIAPESLRVRHPGYDVRSVSRDPGVAFPRDVLVTLEREGRIGSLASTMYSFVGATAQGRLRSVVEGWVHRWQDDGIDVLLLVPV